MGRGEFAANLREAGLKPHTSRFSWTHKNIGLISAFRNKIEIGRFCHIERDANGWKIKMEILCETGRIQYA
jgi:hypothetical protein